ncbi:hypothetical protein VNO77_17767 [Canavalia gladiata]|uniref:AAA+ ATPase domain-containing protein n=1 Tax=Canavalia gladiata TaxID=3824 RepID=A0AAN9QJ01_CANGL
MRTRYHRSWPSESFRSASWTELASAEGFNSRRSKHTEEVNDEDLKWAAIERLPTFDRMRKGMLRAMLDNGNIMHYQVDVTNLSFQDKKFLLENVLKFVDDDNEKFLRRLRDRINRVGIEIPKIEVRFENLSVEGDVYVGRRALPTLLNVTLNILESILGLFRLVPSKKRNIHILKDVSGIIKPSRLALLLGPPGAGKTTLLLTLAGKLDRVLKASGKITYCGHTLNEFVARRTCAYISQHDLHSGQMTVKETLDFSARCLGVGTRYQMLEELSRRERDAGIKPDHEIDAFMKATAISGQKTSLVTDYVLKILGLDICADIMVGDNMTRGISGGQKKRVTTGEMLVGPAKALIPISFMESAIWVILTYYTIGFAPSASRFFRQFLAYFGTHQMSISLYRLIGAVGRTHVIAGILNGLIYQLIYALGGFIVAKNNIKPWMTWGYYMSPMMYGQNALVMNEFLDKRWSEPNTDPRIDAPTVGKVLLKSRGFFIEDYWFWICIGALLGFAFLFNFLFVAALTYLNPLGDSKVFITDEDDKNKKSTSTQQIIREELVANPSIIFMDEPTSGLDARAAAIVMRTVAIEVIYNLIQAVIYTAVIYSMIGFEWKAGKLFSFYYFNMMCFIYYTMYGMMVVALSPSYHIATVASSFFLGLWNLFSGFVIPRTQIPIWWRWYYWASPNAWTIYGLVTSQLGDKNTQIEIPGAKSMRLKELIKESLGYDYHFLPVVAAVHVGWALLFLFVFAYAIKFLNFQKR